MPMARIPFPNEIDLVIYHKSCIDGFGAAFALWKVVPEAMFVSAHYGHEPPNVDGKRVAIVDFSYPRDVLEDMARRAEALIILDHHKTAQEALEGFPNAIFDMTQSGAMLTHKWCQDFVPVKKTFWQRLFSSPPKQVTTDPMEYAREAISRPASSLFFEYIQDRDLWHHALPKTKEFSAGLTAVPFDFEEWDALSVESVIEKGKPVIEAIEREISPLIRKARVVTLRGVDVLAVNYSGKHHSDLGHRLCEATFKDNEKSPLKASLTWFLGDENIFRCSLRSSEDGPDVRRIAESFGGGGHTHAAGFEFDGDIRDILTGKFDT